MIVDRDLYLDASRERLVTPDDPAASFLWHIAGDEVTDEEAASVGYAQKAEPPNKAVEAPPNKAKRTRKKAD